MTDDIGFGDIHAFNPQKGESITPNIDKLAKSGISFHHAHSPAAVCAPTRYAILTGNHVYRGRLPNGTWNPDAPSQILNGQETLGDRLQKYGYHTAFFGKTHLGGVFKNAEGKVVGDFSEADLTRKFNDGVSEHGFDYSLSLPSGIQKSPLAFFRNDRMVRYERATSEFKTLAREEIRQHFKRITDESEKAKYTTEVRGPLYAMDNYTTDSVGPLLMQDALRFLDKHFQDDPDKPFYIHYMSQAGHRPYAPPSAFNVDDPLNTEDRSAPGAISVKGVTLTKRTDMLYESDVALGLFMEKLQAAGQLQNTIIIYTSDNGAEISERIAWSNPTLDAADAHPWYRGPYGGNRTEFGEYPSHANKTHLNGQGVGLDKRALRGMKSFVYEGGHRVPLIIRWGGGKSANSILPPNTKVTNQLISLTDLYRTVCTLAGIMVPDDQALDSYDFSRLLTAPREQSHNPVRDLMAIQAPNLADSATASRKKKMGWAFYSYNSNGEILSAIMNMSKSSEDFEDATMDELYLLTEDEDQTKDIRSSNRDLMDSLKLKFTTFLNKNATHSGQLATPKKATNWRDTVTSE
jgi:arylsulfatase A-like enzyme